MSKNIPFKFPSSIPKRHVVRKGSAGSQVYTAKQSVQYVGYFGVGSINRLRLTDVPSDTSTDPVSYADHPYFHIAAAILRDIYKREFGVNVERHNIPLGVYSPPLTYNSVQDTKCAFRGVTFYSKYRQSSTTAAFTGGSVTGQGRDMIQDSFTLDMSNPLSTFGNRAWKLAWLLQGWYATAIDNGNYELLEIYGYRCQIQADKSSTNSADHSSYTYTPLRRLDDREFSVNVTTDVKMFNRGFANKDDTGGGVISDLTDVEKQDLYGKILYFSDPLPKLNMQVVSDVGPTYTNIYDQSGNSKVLSFDANADGLVYPSGTSYVGLRTMPGAEMFLNCRKESRFLNKVGVTRTIRLQFKFYGRLNKFFEGTSLLTNVSNATPMAAYTGVDPRDLGTFLLFMFQEENPSGGSGTNAYTNVWWTVKRNTYVSMGKSSSKHLYHYDNDIAPEAGIIADALPAGANGTT